MNKDHKEMTIDQAKEAGYFLYMRFDDEMWQELEDIEESYVEEHDDIVLANPFIDPPAMPDADYMMQQIAESICEEASEGAEDEVWDIVTKFTPELEALLDKISAKIKEEKATQQYSSSDVYLIPKSKLVPPNNQPL